MKTLASDMAFVNQVGCVYDRRYAKRDTTAGLLGRRDAAQQLDDVF